MEGDQSKKSSESLGAENSQSTEKESKKPSEPLDIPCARNSNFMFSSSPISPSPFSSIFPAESPPSFVSYEQILKAAEDVKNSGINMALAHEIAVNKDFKLQQTQNSLTKKVSEIFHNAFWDILQEQLSSTPPVYSQALTLLCEIKEILLWLLLPHNARLKNEINDVLDISLIEQQIKTETIDFLSYAQFIISTMSRICAPARDDKLQELRQLTEIVPLYRGIFETLDLMRLDMANFTISHMRPHIQQQSVEYEKSKFQEILQSLSGLTPPIDGLKFTRLWLQDVYEELLKSDTTDMSNAAVLRKAYIKVLMWKDTENFPETLHLDHERFITLRDNLTVMVLTATVILMTYSNVGPSIQGITDFKETLKRNLQILLADIPQCRKTTEIATKLDAVGLQVIKDVNSCLEKHGFPTLTEDKERELRSMMGVIAEEVGVRKLITFRIFEFLEQALHSSTNLKIPPGLSILQNELSTFAGQFLSIVRHNQAVFGEYYNEIINQCKVSQ